MVDELFELSLQNPHQCTPADVRKLKTSIRRHRYIHVLCRASLKWHDPLNKLEHTEDEFQYRQDLTCLNHTTSHHRYHTRDIMALPTKHRSPGNIMKISNRITFSKSAFHGNKALTVQMKRQR